MSDKPANTANTAKVRIEAIDLIKGVAIVAVVLGHVLVDRGFLNAWVYSFQVPLFFFAAGLVFAVKPTGDGAFAGFGTFVAKKLRQLMLPYAVFGLIAIIIYQVAGSLAAAILGRGAADLTWSDCLFGLIFGNAALPQLYFYRPLWFLPCLFAMELLAGALFFALARAKVTKPQVTAVILAVFAVALSVAGLLYVRFGGTPLPWGVETACILMPFFAAGCIIHLLVPPARLDDALSGTPRRRIATACAGAALLAGGVAIAWLNYTLSGGQSVSYVVNEYRLTWAFFLSAALTCAAVTALCFAWKRCRPVAYLGRHTLYILGLHKYPILAFQMLPATAGALAANNVLPAAVVTAVAIAFSLAIEYVAKRVFASLRTRR